MLTKWLVLRIYGCIGIYLYMSTHVYFHFYIQICRDICRTPSVCKETKSSSGGSQQTRLTIACMPMRLVCPSSHCTMLWIFLVEASGLPKHGAERECQGSLLTSSWAALTTWHQRMDAGPCFDIWWGLLFHNAHMHTNICTTLAHRSIYVYTYLVVGACPPRSILDPPSRS